MDFGKCQSCDTTLIAPFVKCENCSHLGSQFYICSSCFSQGREVSRHKNNHPYSIVRLDFPLFETSWSAEEEALLLDALTDHGYGNWDDLCKLLPNKSAEECKRHYEKVYISDGFSLFEGKEGFLPETTVKSQPIPYLSSSNNPCNGSARSNSDFLSGYNAARGDFDVEFENQAELDLCNMEYDDLVNDEDSEKDNASSNGLISRLNFAIIGIYRNKLQERWRRKVAVREFGLLNKSAPYNLARRYPLVAKSRNSSAGIFRLARLLCSYDFDFIMESLTYEAELKQRITYLQECRKNGLTKFHSIPLFEKLSQKREGRLQQVSALSEKIKKGASNSVHQISNNCDKNNRKVLSTVTKRSKIPLDIIGLVDFEKLQDSEKGFCSETRLSPNMYLEIRDLLIDECTKTNGLRLADARPLAKIDVNKTRQIYDFLVRQKIIFAPS